MQKEAVSVVKCASYNNQEVRTALLSSLRNINFQFKKNIRVLIKPNLLSATLPEKAITTHPVIIEELCKILQKHKCKIYIGESSAFDTDQALETCGMNKLSKYAKIINFESSEKKDFNLGRKVHRIPLPKILFQVDLVINVAKMKTHGLTLATLCAKNLYGCIPGRLKEQLHKILKTPKDFAKFIVKLERTIKPELNIIDGVVGIEGNGPAASGTLINPGLIITSKSAPAADIIATRIMGFRPKSVLTNRYSHINEKDIETIGNSKDTRFKFKKPSTFTIPFFMWLTKLFPNPKINFDKKLCKRCHICEKKCPVNAITLKTKDSFPICNWKTCIRCLCCIEVCPHKSVFLKEHWTKELLMKAGKKIIKY
ncbi:MAG: DUF362 domain-containing protein [Nanoarchaeota archaeon]|nr:DUF362 domain-containing protein [Nanoarchaeota archaeon]MBU4086559.1 DUF362 domain-containing protein [Nanoarchaeota archaeon]